MKAYNLHAVSDLRYEDVPKPVLQKGWALVKVKAAGICSSDIPRIFKKGTYHFPTIPGHEFSGYVEDVGDAADKDWIGAHVGVFPLIPCRNCEFCKVQKYELCTHYDYLGSRRDGGFAELVAVPIWNLVKLPDGISFRQAAVLEPLAVALHAVKRAHIHATSKVAIIGTGAIGFAAAQWCLTCGAESVTILSKNEGKRKLAAQFENILYKTYQELKSDEKYNVVIEAVGTNQAITTALDIADTEGSLVLMGNPEGDILLRQDIYWKILRKQLTITGTWNSSYTDSCHDDWKEVVAAIAAGKIVPETLITHVYQQQDLPAALNMMKEHRETYCKVVIEWNE